jgi:hypothetical protein
MNYQLAIIVATGTFAVSMLVRAIVNWFQSRNAIRISVLSDGNLIELDARNPDDARQIADIVGRLVNEPEVVAERSHRGEKAMRVATH